MEKQELKVEEPVTVDGYTIIPVAKAARYGIHQKRSIYLQALKVPIAVVILTPDKHMAFDLTGESIPLDELLKNLPELAVMIKKYYF
jgi:uncharacterized spore protein YtfJ